jgi:hypothetical protein
MVSSYLQFKDHARTTIVTDRIKEIRDPEFSQPSGY